MIIGGRLQGSRRSKNTSVTTYAYEYQYIYNCTSQEGGSGQPARAPSRADIVVDGGRSHRCCNNRLTATVAATADTHEFKVALFWGHDFSYLHHFSNSMAVFGGRQAGSRLTAAAAAAGYEGRAACNTGAA